MLSTVLTLVKATMDYFMFVWLCCLIQIIVASSGSLLHDCTDGVLDAEGANLIGLASVTVIILALAKRRQKRERKRRSRWMCPTLRRRLDYGPEDMLAGYVEDDTDPRTRGDLTYFAIRNLPKYQGILLAIVVNNMSHITFLIKQICIFPLYLSV